MNHLATAFHSHIHNSSAQNIITAAFVKAIPFYKFRYCEISFDPASASSLLLFPNPQKPPKRTFDYQKPITHRTSHIHQRLCSSIPTLISENYRNEIEIEILDWKGKAHELAVRHLLNSYLVVHEPGGDYRPGWKRNMSFRPLREALTQAARAALKPAPNQQSKDFTQIRTCRKENFRMDD
jgi:hypothetical protein